MVVKSKRNFWEGDKQDIFLRERHKQTGQVGINNNIHTEKFSIHKRRNIYDKLSGAYLNNNLKKRNGNKKGCFNRFKCTSKIGT